MLDGVRLQGGADAQAPRRRVDTEGLHEALGQWSPVLQDWRASHVGPDDLYEEAEEADAVPPSEGREDMGLLSVRIVANEIAVLLEDRGCEPHRFVEAWLALAQLDDVDVLRACLRRIGVSA